MRFYKAHLTRRLILELSADQEKEEQMITRFCYLNFCFKRLILCAIILFLHLLLNVIFY